MLQDTFSKTAKNIFWLKGWKKYFLLKSLLIITFFYTLNNIKTCRWNFFKLSWLVHYRKICKTRFKNRGYHAIFSVLEANISKILQKLNKTDCFCLHSWFHFLWSFFAQKLTDTINIWFNFVVCSIFEQDHLLNFIILGDYARLGDVHVFRNRNWCSTKSDRWLFF